MLGKHLLVVAALGFAFALVGSGACAVPGVQGGHPIRPGMFLHAMDSSIGVWEICDEANPQAQPVLAVSGDWIKLETDTALEGKKIRWVNTHHFQVLHVSE